MEVKLTELDVVVLSSIVKHQPPPPDFFMVLLGQRLLQLYWEAVENGDE